MQEVMHSKSSVQERKPVGENVVKELKDLRDELSRTAHEIRMKSKGASAEVRDTGRDLEREVQRFSAQVDSAAKDTAEYLRRVGKDLRARFQQLASQIVGPAS